MMEGVLTGNAPIEAATIRRVWYEDRWWFSVVDVVGALVDSKNPRLYWGKLKERLAAEGFEMLTICQRLKLKAADGKFRDTDCADAAGLLRIIQSVPSPKAEPFKQWLAQVGQERLAEADDPEQGLQEWRRRAIRSYMAKGYSEAWATNRVEGILARNALTGEWIVRGIDQRDIGPLTDELHMGEFGLTIVDHAEFKGMEIVIVNGYRTYKGNLRAGMTPMELAIALFGDSVARALHIERDSYGLAAITRDVRDAGQIAGGKRREIEQLTGKPVVSARNLAIEPDGGLWGQLDDGDR